MRGFLLLLCLLVGCGGGGGGPLVAKRIVGVAAGQNSVGCIQYYVVAEDGTTARVPYPFGVVAEKHPEKFPTYTSDAWE